jgi:hypothetical protein
MVTGPPHPPKSTAIHHVACGRMWRRHLKKNGYDACASVAPAKLLCKGGATAEGGARNALIIGCLLRCCVGWDCVR